MRTLWHRALFFARTHASAWAAACLLAVPNLHAAGQGAVASSGQIEAQAAASAAAPASAMHPAASAAGASTPALRRWHGGLHPGVQQGMAAVLAAEPPAPAPEPATLWPGTDAADAALHPLPPRHTAPSLAEPPHLPALTTPAQPRADLTLGQAHLNLPSRPALGLRASKGKELGRGVASWYGPGFHGRLTANGERFDMNAMTAAHKTLPFGTRVLVHNPRTGKQVVVRINDRGPFVKGRVIDLSSAAASALGLKARGHDNVVLHELPRQAAAKAAKAPPKAKTSAKASKAKAKNKAKAKAKAKTPARHGAR